MSLMLYTARGREPDCLFEQNIDCTVIESAEFSSQAVCWCQQLDQSINRKVQSYDDAKIKSTEASVAGPIAGSGRKVSDTAVGMSYSVDRGMGISPSMLKICWRRTMVSCYKS